MMYKLSTIILLFALLACKAPDAEKVSILNDGHLSHLTESFDSDGEALSAVWIYCEAPDYHLVGDEDEGFSCVDDVARAMVYLIKAQKEKPNDERRQQIEKFARFIFKMQADNGYFYNFIFEDKSINTDHINSTASANWWSWRAFWALSELIQLDQTQISASIKDKAVNSMQILLPHILSICPGAEVMQEVDGVSFPSCIAMRGTDQLSILVLGLCNYYQKFPTQDVKDFILKACGLMGQMQLGDENNFPYYASMSWQNYWHAWGNLQAYSLLVAGDMLQDTTIINHGLREVASFYPYYLKEWPSSFRLVRKGETYAAEDLAAYPQIAYNLRPMVFASLKAYEITGDQEYATLAKSLGTWFFGKNQAGQKMYDVSSGRTFDGIVSPIEVNRNSGAESTIEALLALQALDKHPDILSSIIPLK